MERKHAYLISGCESLVASNIGVAVRIATEYLEATEEGATARVQKLKGKTEEIDITKIRSHFRSYESITLSAISDKYKKAGMTPLTVTITKVMIV